ncbi:membrane transport family protein [Burkholderia thailandensis E254]|uniref:Auxin efflux carrier, putative n=1 Tax=Burkholderia thailandensis (strain ATCC 700388 / DSM 13276 / CCUG 48851 / CIP 106301 / E264) TaxID=271848 RepID=Q2T3G1_BURTA|nr:AEC family transporter [Burkholderia thailandensis]ABC35961.1 auxin efflux carrier, putative [Burkholderia thailandensis E264]AHI75103.1 membrane transport family protein [Burkholderia thailandensis 2002721723]AIP26760.1 membrane transport family protein [Burkholderia thailandensis E264]AIT24367.1 membrane transport family protein [Burkholderia thailandensis E254]AJY00943.1 membrane transport family protein [Burkholderia thailandensis 2002721643]
MASLILVLACLVAGAALARSKRLPANFPASLNYFVIQISLPALVLQHLHKIAFGADMLWLLATPAIVFAATAVLALAAGALLRLDKATVGCLTLVCGTSNTSIVGVPVVQALIGSAAVGHALVIDQANFIVMCTAGLVAADLYAGSATSWRGVARQLAGYRPIQAMALALLLRPVPFPPAVEDVLTALGATLTPIAMISVGASFSVRHARDAARNFLVGIGFKLLAVPAIVLACGLYVFSQRGVPLTVALVQATMPPMIIAGLIAIDKKLDPPLAGALMTLGVPASIAAAWLWRGVLPY